MEKTVQSDKVMEPILLTYKGSYRVFT